MIITRFAPSPTGYLHIGSARTALFNWLFSRHHGGKFLLRIEDTDRARSTQDAVDKIFQSLKWLGLDWDEEPVFQFERAQRHVEVAKKLLEEGKAYYCYCTPEELDQMREDAKKNHLPPKYNGFWRDRDQSLAPKDVKPVIRFKAPKNGETIIHDQVQGTVTIQNTQLDDMVLVRADGTPTYMLSVVVDDHDMNITHVIRGDDHLTNAFRQKNLYEACGWDVPIFAHIPLIHGPDGAKLSKRHGAVGAESYKADGFLAEAMRNYLLRLGWAHGDDEIIPTQQAIEWFNLEGIGRSPARFDTQKLLYLNAHYIKETPHDVLCDYIQPILKEKFEVDISEFERKNIILGMEGLKKRAKTLNELAENALVYCVSPTYGSEDIIPKKIEKSKELLSQLNESLVSLSNFSEQSLEQMMRTLAERQGEKLGVIAEPLRIALTGKLVSPSLFEVMAIIGKEETLKRVNAFLKTFD